MVDLNQRIAVAALVVCGMLGGCSSVGQPAAPASGEKMSPAQMEALGAQAEQAIAAGNNAAAVALYEQLLQAYPNSAPAWFRLGTVHLRMNQQRVAQYDFERALQADPNLSKAQANLALTHLRQFRVAATAAIASDQVSEDNRATLRSLMRDVDHALFPVATVGAPPLPPVSK
jgi:tetratricopeptide (TPR) repeat protein